MKIETTKSNGTVFERWVTRDRVKEFFGYGQTKMSSFSRDHNVRSRKIGNRIFYFSDDIKRLLESDLTDDR